MKRFIRASEIPLFMALYGYAGVLCGKAIAFLILGGYLPLRALWPALFLGTAALCALAVFILMRLGWLFPLMGRTNHINP